MSESASRLKILLDLGVEAEDDDREDDREDDTVPGLDVPDDNLTVLEDFILQLPAGPPGADHESVEEAVGDDGVQDQAVPLLLSMGLQVAAGTEDVAGGVQDDGNWGPGGGAEGSEVYEGRGRYEED